MKILKIIQHENYKFEITIESKTEHAHSLMSDYKGDLTIHLNYFIDFISSLVKVHKETKK